MSHRPKYCFSYLEPQMRNHFGYFSTLSSFYFIEEARLSLQTVYKHTED